MCHAPNINNILCEGECDKEECYKKSKKDMKDKKSKKRKKSREGEKGDRRVLEFEYMWYSRVFCHFFSRYI